MSVCVCSNTQMVFFVCVDECCLCLCRMSVMLHLDLHPVLSAWAWGVGGGSGASSHMVRRVGSARLVFVYGFGGFVRLTSGSRVAGTFEILSCSYLQQIIPGFD